MASLTTPVVCPSTRRLLGHTEHLLLVSNRDIETSIYASINLIESKREIGIGEVRNAFGEANKMNFLMHACVKSNDNGQSYFFQSMSEKILKSDWMLIDEISLADGESWEQVISKILERKLDYKNGPLWTVVWLRTSSNENDTYSYTLIFVASHAICDGKAGFNLICNQIIPCLNGKVPTQKTIYFTRSQEEIFDVFTNEQMSLSNRPMPFQVRLLGNIIAWKQYFSRWIWGEPELPNIYHNYSSYLLDKKTTRALIGACKSRGKTVHSVLMVLLYNALMKTQSRYRIPVENLMFYPVDLRKFDDRVNGPTMPFGNYQHNGQHFMRYVTLDDEEDLFKMADEVMLESKEYNRPNPKITNAEPMFVLLAKGELTPSVVDCFPISCTFSNLGNLDDVIKDDNKDTKVVLLNHYFTVQTRIGFMVGLNTFNGYLHVTVSSGSQENRPGVTEFLRDNFKLNMIKFVELYNA